MNKDHSVFKEKIISFFSFNQHCGLILSCANVFIDWNWFSGERCGPWTSCFKLYGVFLAGDNYFFFSRLRCHICDLLNVLILSMYFRYFVIISPWKRAGPFIWTNLNLLHPRMLCDKIGCNWPSSSGEEDFFNFVNVFSLFRNYLPLEKGGALNLNKLESPSPKDALCQVWLK